MPKGKLSDSIIELVTHQSRNDYPKQLRRVEYYDEELKKNFVFLTNALDITALEVALLYKNRWSVELFFKWLKQHLKVKKFCGDSENAVRIQIYTATISYCLVAIVHHQMKLDRTIYETYRSSEYHLPTRHHFKTSLTNLTSVLTKNFTGSMNPLCLIFNFY